MRETVLIATLSTRDQDGVLPRSDATVPATTLDQVVGMLKHHGPARTIEEMDASVLEEARRRARD